MKNLLFVCLVAVAANVNCQSDTQPTWDDISWIAGNWIGDGFGGVSYESWSEPIAGTILGTYRHVSDGKNNFFELFTITENEDGTFIMKLRHFNPDMNAWEDKEGQLVWEFKSVNENAFTFGPCTYKRIGDDKMEISLVMNNDGKIETEIFNFKRM